MSQRPRAPRQGMKGVGVFFETIFQNVWLRFLHLIFFILFSIMEIKSSKLDLRWISGVRTFISETSAIKLLMKRVVAFTSLSRPSYFRPATRIMV